MERAIFAAGCFWGVEAAFRRLEGVSEAYCGYCGGHVEQPDYRQVCQGNTGHAEAVDVHYDPNTISYDALLQAFWHMHDPTQLNRQGPDVGTQYRSAIFPLNDAQKKQAVDAKAKQSAALGVPLATTIEPHDAFWKAEDYHQRYFEKNGAAACHI